MDLKKNNLYPQQSISGPTFAQFTVFFSIKTYPLHCVPIQLLNHSTNVTKDKVSHGQSLLLDSYVVKSFLRSDHPEAR